MDPFFSIHMAKSCNLLFFNKNLSLSWRQRLWREAYFFLVFKVLSKTSLLLWENNLFLLLVLLEKYKCLGLRYKTIDFLTMRYDSALEVIAQINKFREKIRQKDGSTVTKALKLIVSKKMDYQKIFPEDPLSEFQELEQRDLNSDEFLDEVKLIY